MFEENSKLQKIYQNAFTGADKRIKGVIIPNSVTYLHCKVFNDDDL